MRSIEIDGLHKIIEKIEVEPKERFSHRMTIPMFHRLPEQKQKYKSYISYPPFPCVSCGCLTV